MRIGKAVSKATDHKTLSMGLEALGDVEHWRACRGAGKDSNQSSDISSINKSEYQNV